MSISENIRRLAREGLRTAEIARRLGIRYQHAYNVLKQSNELPASSGAIAAAMLDISLRSSRASKPTLNVDELTAGGFVLSARWILSTAGDLVLDQSLPKDIGVYAFAKGQTVLYVGVATMGLAKRLYFYRKPGPRQRTSQRIGEIIKSELLSAPHIDIYTATPPDLEWNGFPVHGCAGLELGLIKKFTLPWNIRGAG